MNSSRKLFLVCLKDTWCLPDSKDSATSKCSVTSTSAVRTVISDRGQQHTAEHNWKRGKPQQLRLPTLAWDKWAWAFCSYQNQVSKLRRPSLLSLSYCAASTLLPFSARLCDHTRHDPWGKCLTCLFFLSTAQLQSNHPRGHHLQALFNSYSLLLDTVSDWTKKELKYTYLSV